MRKYYHIKLICSRKTCFQRRLSLLMPEHVATAITKAEIEKASNNWTKMLSLLIPERLNIHAVTGVPTFAPIITFIACPITDIPNRNRLNPPIRLRTLKISIHTLHSSAFSSSKRMVTTKHQIHYQSFPIVKKSRSRSPCKETISDQLLFIYHQFELKTKLFSCLSA